MSKAPAKKSRMASGPVLNKRSSKAADAPANCPAQNPRPAHERTAGDRATCPAQVVEHTEQAPRPVQLRATV
ncbi:hypothetical protein PBRA_009204 [Plasmodiophora brassicae]|uniref:Uncharacterized protein n=1 Tax=Plasmodiophora brassicae TaxID=37360 RepID=A0A0G4J6R8_PLABS|nr:hypothetical protein PBRA_009204 [Plasmodiophora brassicae]